MGEKKEDGSGYPCSEGLCKLSVDEEEDEDSENKKHKMLEKLDVIPECDRKPVKCDLGYEEPGKDNQDSRFAGFSSSRGGLCWKTAEHERCEYYVQKMKGLNSPITIFNYNYFLIESNYVGDFGGREVLIADEGHNIEFQIANFIKFMFSNKNFKFLPDSNFPDLGNISLQ
jgi:Rad3-related DNA helicase